MQSWNPTFRKPRNVGHPATLYVAILPAMFDWTTFLTTLMGSGLVSIGVVRGLSGHLADRWIARYKSQDPSFHNWDAMELANRQNAISDFPVCNKSCNLAYNGHDL